MAEDIYQGQALHGVPNPPPRAQKARECSECGNTWMKEIRIGQYQDFQVILGHPPPMLDPGLFYLYECIKCGHLNQPALVYEGQNEVRRLYEGLLTIIKGINAARKRSE